jgi:UDPglucose--hexose-1-phosphate uridylyltransferase
VVIESATHRRRLTELTHSEVELVFHAYRDRLSTIRRQGHYRYALIFKNSGRDAGMTREHLHSQLVALPEVPPLVRLELLGSVRFFRTHRRCAFCQLVDETTRDQRRVVLETETVLAFCPYASRVAYEVWVLPKRHEACFEQTDDRTLNAVARGVRDVVERLETRLGPLAYNFVLHSNPFDTTCQDHYHWHIEILPRTSRLAGLEWGTGLLVNTIQPEVAAEQLRELAKL